MIHSVLGMKRTVAKQFVMYFIILMSLKAFIGAVYIYLKAKMKHGRSKTALRRRLASGCSVCVSKHHSDHQTEEL